MNRKALLTAAVLALAALGCEPEEGVRDDAAAPGETAGGRTVIEETQALEETTTVDAAEQTVPEVVSVGASPSKVRAARRSRYHRSPPSGKRCRGTGNRYNP